MSNLTTLFRQHFFHGGVHPAEGKELTAAMAIQPTPLLDRYTVLIQQNIGAPPKPIVKAGDLVKKGQRLAEPGGFVSVPVHAPTSGKVAAIEDVPGPFGIPAPAFVIEADGQDEFDSGLAPIPDFSGAAPDVLRDRIRDAGLVGMGGAAFPTHVKLSPPADKKIDVLILNGAECEPYLTADHRLMLETPEDILAGAAIFAKVLGVKEIWIGIENNKPDAIRTLSARAAEFGVKVVGLKVRYPQGAEKQLIYALTGRKVPAGGLPMDAGCVVQNVGTAAAAAAAVLRGEPLIERATTITGRPVVRPGNWRLRIGTPLGKALELAGGIAEQPAKLIFGGPMMGLALYSLDVPVMKSTSGILLLTHDEVAQFTSEPCIRCGRCVDVCPMTLMAGPLSVMAEAERYDLAEEANIMDCMECGSCAYVCPARRPLTQHFKRAKAEVAAMRRKRQAK
jgi:electron transport complex protein RnfC